MYLAVEVEGRYLWTMGKEWDGPRDPSVGKARYLPSYL